VQAHVALAQAERLADPRAGVSEHLRTALAGRAVEPLVRSSIQTPLADEHLGGAQFAGSFWNRDGSVEVTSLAVAIALRASRWFQPSLTYRCIRQRCCRGWRPPSR
jgi:hypothetical protein